MGSAATAASVGDRIGGGYEVDEMERERTPDDFIRRFHEDLQSACVRTHVKFTHCVGDGGLGVGGFGIVGRVTSIVVVVGVSEILRHLKNGLTVQCGNMRRYAQVAIF